MLFSYQSSLLLVWSSLSILSNRKKFVNNFFHLFPNFFLIWWNLCCFALFSLTAWLWYHSYFELSTVFLIILKIYLISFLSTYIRHTIYVNTLYMILYLCCLNCHSLRYVVIKIPLPEVLHMRGENKKSWCLHRYALLLFIFSS